MLVVSKGLDNELGKVHACMQCDDLHVSRRFAARALKCPKRQTSNLRNIHSLFSSTPRANIVDVLPGACAASSAR